MPARLQLLDPLRGRQVDLAGQVLEAGIRVRQLFEQLVLIDAEDACKLGGGRRWILDLIRRREHAHRLLRERQRLAVAVENRSADTRDHHRLGLLAVGVGPVSGSLHRLQPGCANQDQDEKRDERGKQKAESAVNQVHGVIPPAVGAVAAGAGRRGGLSRNRGLGGRDRGDRLGRNRGFGALGKDGSDGGRGRHVLAADRNRALAEAIGGGRGVSRLGLEVADRTGLRHDEPEAVGGALNALVGQSGFDLGAQRGVLLQQLVRERRGLARGRAEAEGEDVEGHDPHEERTQEPDPKAAARQPQDDARVGDATHGDGCPAHGDRDEPRPGTRSGARGAPRGRPGGAGRCGAASARWRLACCCSGGHQDQFPAGRAMLVSRLASLIGQDQFPAGRAMLVSRLASLIRHPRSARRLGLPARQALPPRVDAPSVTADSTPSRRRWVPPRAS